MTFVKQYPVVFLVILLAFAREVISGLIAFGVDLSDPQQAAIYGVFGTLVGIVLTLYTNQPVQPPGGTKPPG